MIIRLYLSIILPSVINEFSKGNLDILTTFKMTLVIFNVTHLSFKLMSEIIDLFPF